MWEQAQGIPHGLRAAAVPYSFHSRAQCKQPIPREEMRHARAKSWFLNQPSPVLCDKWKRELPFINNDVIGGGKRKGKSKAAEIRSLKTPS